MQREFNAWQALIACFYAKALYRDVAHNHHGVGFSFLLILQGIILTPVMIWMLWVADTEIFAANNGEPSRAAILVDDVSSQLPLLQWREGVLSSPAEQPYIIEVSIAEQEQLLAILDSQATAQDMVDSDANILITADGIHMRKESGAIESRFWKEMNADGSFDLLDVDADSGREIGMQALQWLLDNRVWIYSGMGLFAWCIMLMLLMIWRVFQVLFFALIMRTASLVWQPNIPYETAMRLCSYALGPPVIVSTAAAMLSLPFPPLLFLAMLVGYMIFAVKAARTT